MKYVITPPTLLITLILCCFFIATTGTVATAVPVLESKVKRPATPDKHTSAAPATKGKVKQATTGGKTTKKSKQQTVQTAAPAARDKAKQAKSVGKTTKSSKQQTVQASVPTPAAKVLGSYRDISPAKRVIVTDRPAPATPAQEVTAAPVESEQHSSPGCNSLQKKISAKSVIVMDAANGQTIFSLSPDTPRQPASTIKILTGLIAIKSLDFNDTVPVSLKAAEQPSSKVYLEKQKQYKADDLINAVLLSSANDASVALAEKIAGSEQSFARMMTLRAKLCGAQKTVCKTANGLTAEGQSTTARDLATIFKHAMQDDEFSQRMKQVKARTAEGKLLRNHNKALWQIEGAEGGKTGFTNAAGQTYVGKFKRGGKEIIVALMGSTSMWADLKTLVDYGFAQPSTLAKAPAELNTTRIVAGGSSGQPAATPPARLTPAGPFSTPPPSNGQFAPQPMQ